ncbi:MAG: rhodanese-like domain-containing protein [Spirochaetota bacterium]
MGPVRGRRRLVGGRSPDPAGRGRGCCETRTRRAASHVAGAIHIPLDALRDRLAEIPRGRPLLVYCESGRRSHLATRILLQGGFDRATNVIGAYTSLERYERAVGFEQIRVALRESYAGGGCTAVPGDLPPIGTTDDRTELVVDVHRSSSTARQESEARTRRHSCAAADTRA